METQRKYIILVLVALFFIVLFLYFLQDRYYHLEKFSSIGNYKTLGDIQDDLAIQPILLDNTTLSEYKDTWTNASIIANKGKLVLKDKLALGFIYEKPESTVRGVTVNNMDWKAYFDEYADLAINGLPYNKESAYDHYLRYTVNGVTINGQYIKENRFVNKLYLWREMPNKVSNDRFSISYWIYINNPSVNWQTVFHLGTRPGDHLVQNWGGRHPGIWLWPNQPTLHVRQNIGTDWNSGTGSKETGEWNKEYERQSLSVHRPYFITHVFHNDKTSLYVNGEKRYEHVHENPAAPLKDAPVYLTVGQQLPLPSDGSDYSYVLKDVHMYYGALSATQVANLYELNKDNGGNGEDALQAIKQDSSSEGFQIMNSLGPSSTVESFSAGPIILPPTVKDKDGNGFNFENLDPQADGDAEENAVPEYTSAGSIPTGPKKEVLLEKDEYGLYENKTLNYIDFKANDKQYFIDLKKINKQIKFDQNTGASFAFWMKYGRTNDWSEKRLFTFGLGNGWYIYCPIIGKTLYFSFWKANEPIVSIPVQNVIVDEWVHVAWVIRNDEEKSWTVYVNGVEHTTVNGKMAVYASGTGQTDHQSIGMWDGKTRFFPGCLGDFRIYQGELTEEQVKHIGGFKSINNDIDHSGPKNEVFHIKGYTHTKDQSESKCAQFGGANVATREQVYQAQYAGADWCSTGWVQDESIAMYPITTTLVQGCGNGTPGIKYYTPTIDGVDKAGINCYGVKPGKSDSNAGQLRDWKPGQWSRYGGT
jgi:hypothetical protein